MAEGARDDDEIFVYMGGDQQVPDGVRRARIHKSVKIVPKRAFQYREQLIYVEFHDDIEIIEEQAFFCCESLRGDIKLLGVRIIKARAFYGTGVTDVEFGDELQIIERGAFQFCRALKKIKLPTVRPIVRKEAFYCRNRNAFYCRRELSDAECGEELRTLQGAFNYCPKLKRIALPLKGIMIRVQVFNWCPKLTTVDLGGGVHNTVASLHMVSWRSEMMNKVNRINQTLPTTSTSKDKTGVIRHWMISVNRQLDYYKAEHQKLLKEATTLLELALWKANLGDNGGGSSRDREGYEVRTTLGSREKARKELRVTSGADVVIKNVLPFLRLE
eukprot:scaffold7578_cov192-Skeletonema_menzelii.AAC.2